MSDQPTFDLTLTGPQMDFLGKFVVDTLNAAQAQAKMASEIYQLMRTAVTPVAKPPPAAGLTIVQNPQPEAPVSTA